MSVKRPPPSPSEAKMMTKRPRAPSAASFQKSSPLSMASPSDWSESKTSKRIRAEGPGSGEVVSMSSDERKVDTSNMSKGARWMLNKLEVMEKQYRESLSLATQIIHFQADAKRLNMKRMIPPHMKARLDNSWATYECTRRLIESYMVQNAQYVASPMSRFTAPLIASSIPMPSAIPSHLLATSQPHPVASPIPLSTASFLTHEVRSDTKSNTPNLQGNVSSPSLGTNGTPNFDTSMFNNLVSSQSIDLSQNNQQGQVDFSNLNLGDFTAMMNNQTMSNNTSMPDYAALLNQSGNSDMSGLGLGGMGMIANNPKSTISALTPRSEQAQTEDLLASFNYLQQQQQNQNNSNTTQAPTNQLQQLSGQISQDSQAILDSLNNLDTSSGQGGMTDFDMFTNGLDGGGGGDLGLSNMDMSALVGLLDSGNTNNLGQGGTGTQSTSNDLNLSNLGSQFGRDASSLMDNSQNQNQSVVDSFSQMMSNASNNMLFNNNTNKSSNTSITDMLANTSTASIADIMSGNDNNNNTLLSSMDNLDQTDSQNRYDNESGLDLDDYNFGDGDQMPQVGGDDFESLFREFE